MRLNGGTCSGGVVSPAAGQFYGGYASGNPIGYTVLYNGGFTFDYNATVNLKWSYSVSGSATEIIASNVGFYDGPVAVGGTSTGSANAQVVAAAGFTLAPGNSTTFTAGFTNTGAATINVESTGVQPLRKKSFGSVVALTGSEVTLSRSYQAVWDGIEFILNANSALLPSNNTPSTTFQLPNALDNNPSAAWDRIPGVAPATSSVTSALYSEGPTTSCPLTSCVNFGAISMYIGNTVDGHLQSAWIIVADGGGAPYENGGGGTWFGQGVYSNVGGSPFNGGVVDMGPGNV